MGTPKEYLPPRLDDDTITNLLVSLDLPAPSRIQPLDAAAEYHSIYLLLFNKDLASSIPARQKEDGSIELILRVSGRHLPGYKTRNEVGCMTWIRNTTSIPVPAIVRWSDNDNNPTGHEFTLLEKVPGVSVDKVYKNLDSSQRRYLVEQLVVFLAQLHNHPWPASVGGLILQPNGTVELGPPVEETLWQQPDIDKYWPGETLESINALQQGPHSSFTAYVTASCHKYCYAIQTHSSLERFRDMIPSIHRFLERINTPQWRDVLDDTKYVTAHKDLHFANIMCDPASLRITSILDWEFSGVVPAPMWDPSKAFLWNASSDATANTEKYELRKVFEVVCEEKGLQNILNDMKPSSEQQKMMTAVSYVRAITEVCPRGQCQDLVDKWKEEALTAMSFF
ncbi:phosphotransferase enzyme family protein [Sarocladium implicatum]|nr:phosphotransferase enzyme family protein [Sarocladium implicatum]